MLAGALHARARGEVSVGRAPATYENSGMLD